MKRPSLANRIYAKTVFYPTLGWNMLLGRILKVRNWYDFIDDHVIVGARPFARDVAGLAQAGVKAVVNTCEEYGGPVAEYDQYGIEQLHIPTVDFMPPSLESIQQSVRFVQKHVGQNHTVYIHCKAGRARSATVALCWLIAHRNMTAEVAQTWLLRKRPHVHPRLPERQVVKDFVASRS
jgi:atypical dual specificity phosphatase